MSDEIQKPAYEMARYILKEMLEGGVLLNVTAGIRSEWLINMLASQFDQYATIVNEKKNAEIQRLQAERDRFQWAFDTLLRIPAAIEELLEDQDSVAPSGLSIEKKGDKWCVDFDSYEFDCPYIGMADTLLGALEACVAATKGNQDG